MEAISSRKLVSYQILACARHRALILINPGVLAKPMSGQEIDNEYGVFVRLEFVCIMTAFGQDSQLSFGEATVEGHALLYLEKEAPVGIQDQGRTTHQRQDRPDIEKISRRILLQTNETD